MATDQEKLIKKLKEDAKDPENYFGLDEQGDQNDWDAWFEGQGASEDFMEHRDQVQDPKPSWQSFIDTPEADEDFLRERQNILDEEEALEKARKNDPEGES